MDGNKRVRAYKAMSRHWVFTLNNPQRFQQTVDFDDTMHSYLIAGREMGENHTPHIQGYVCFITRKRLTGCKKWLPRAHWEVMRGTPVQASTYCKKDGDFEEYGTLPVTQKQAVQMKWDEALKSAKKRKFDEINSQMLVQYYHNWKKIAEDNPVIPNNLDKLENYWVVAPTGYGKSYYVRERWPDFYDKAPNKWWTGYRGQKVVLCDDFGPKQCEHLEWYAKRWCDIYPFKMETKGSGDDIRPTHIVWTSQYQIDECFHGLVLEAMMRRMTIIQLRPWREREQEIADLRTLEELDSHVTGETETEEIFSDGDSMDNAKFRYRNPSPPEEDSIDLTRLYDDEGPPRKKRKTHTWTFKPGKGPQ